MAGAGTPEGFFFLRLWSLETPTVEFLEVFGREIGTTPSRELYRFFDREGNTLVLRPDFTPSIARAASMYFHGEKRPLRFSYQGNTFTNNVSYQGRLRESTQMGVELLGDASPDRTEKSWLWRWNFCVKQDFQIFRSVWVRWIFSGLWPGRQV